MKKTYIIVGYYCCQKKIFQNTGSDALNIAIVRPDDSLARVTTTNDAP